MIKVFQILTMARLFIFLAFISIFMIIASGSGVYFMSKGWIAQSKEESATAVAKAVASTLSAQMSLLTQILGKIEQDPEVLATIKSANPALLSTEATKLEQCFPDVLKIRLFVPGITPADAQAVPKVGFADIEMVGETFNHKQLPAIQGDQGPDRHLALTGRIMENNQVIGVVLVSLKFDFIAKSIKNAAAKNEYIELKQAALVLGVSGEKTDTTHTNIVPLHVPDTDWDILYHYVGTTSTVDFTLIIIIIVIPVLFTLLAFFSIQRKLSGLLAQDVNCVIKAVKDLMATQKLHSTYPVHLTEMNGVISTLVQFKRVLDSEKNKEQDKIEEKNPISGYDDLELDNFFDD